MQGVPTALIRAPPVEEGAVSRTTRASCLTDVYKTTPTEVLQLEQGMLMALEILNEYTVEEGAVAAGSSRISRA